MLQKGDHIDIWVVEKPLGSGGMGSVYRCHNRKATRILAAVKVLESNLRKHPQAEARFIREAEILFQLDHPSIVKVRNVRTDVDPPYLEMEFVAGESLEERLHRGALPYGEAVVYMQQMASAISYLHQKGVRHRDIKPANLLVTPDAKMKLVDFGLAMETDTARITQQGMTFGTVSYAPPEWIAPDTLDASKWDLYAIGVVYYEMLTGEVAFPVSGQGSSRQQAMQVIVNKQGHEPLDPGEYFHDDVRELIRDMTMSDANKRISSAAEVVRRTRALVLSLRRDSGVTLAPNEDELSASWNDDLDKTPVHIHQHNTIWMGTDDDAEDTLRSTPTGASSLVQAPTAQAAEHPEVPLSTLNGPTAAPSSSPTRTTLRAVVALFILVVSAAVTVSIGAMLFAYQSNMAAAPRPVEVIVTGLTSDSSLGIRVAGIEPSSANGLQYKFANMAIGPTQIISLLGERCQVSTCPGPECPAWCVVQEHELTVSSGDGPQIVLLPLAPPNPRRVKLNLSKIEGEWPLHFSLGPRLGKNIDNTIVFDALVPGNYTLTARGGE
ncbi:MAG: protein kinase, partial [Rhodobacterales bacterium]|nr:protein kinase [Rhodobacterales bacterium]